jgi:hypothetical protein
MGNDNSVLSEFEIQEPSYANVGEWTLHRALKKNDTVSELTVFMTKLKSYGQVHSELRQAVEV